VDKRRIQATDHKKTDFEEASVRRSLISRKPETRKDRKAENGKFP